MSTPATRADGRQAAQLRPITFEANIAPHATGSVLVSFGRTRVICAATIEPGVPTWMKQQKVSGGWLTAEYSMLPYSTHERKARDISRGKIDGRTVEIQRLIGRSLRAVLDLEKLGANTLWVDCDVLEADGGTRCASITGAFVALVLALGKLKNRDALRAIPVSDYVAATSVGIVGGMPLLDLAYEEDSKADVDMNIVKTSDGRFIEIQGTAEAEPFGTDALTGLLALADKGITDLVAKQREIIGPILGR